jgi:hypothetical protein
MNKLLVLMKDARDNWRKWKETAIHDMDNANAYAESRYWEGKYYAYKEVIKLWE